MLLILLLWQSHNHSPNSTIHRRKCRSMCVGVAGCGCGRGHVCADSNDVPACVFTPCLGCCCSDAAAVGDGDIVALGDPLKPQGFYPVKTKTLWPGEQLTVGCEFDSSDVATTVVAGSDHNHEMCNMYLMVYSSLSHLEMCNDGSSMVDELAPGNMPHSAALLKDPYPLWKPPKPQDKLEKVNCVCW